MNGILSKMKESDHMLVLEHISKKFGNFTAVDDISLTVGKGEIFGFIGPNGAGKTTTIKMIAGLLKPDAGQILINKKNLRNLPGMNFSSSLPVSTNSQLIHSQRTRNIFSSFLTCWTGSTTLLKAIHTVCDRN